MAVTSDAGLVRSVLSGERERFGELVDRYLPAVMAVAAARLSNQADSEDVAQETFIAAYRSLGQLRELEKFPAWLMTICRHECARFLSGRKRETDARTALSDTPRRAPAESELLERREVVEKMLLELDPDAREIVQLFYFAGLSNREIAGMLDISEAAARKRLERARTALSDNVIASLSATEADRTRLKKQTKEITALVLASTAGTAIAGSTSLATAGILGIKPVILVAAVTVLVALMGVGAYRWSESGTPNTDPRPAEIEVLGLGSDSQAASEKPGTQPTATQGGDSVQTPAAQVSASEPAAEHRINVRPAIRGIVVNHAGNPVSGATVRAVRIMGEERAGELETLSRDDGSFEFPDVTVADRLWVIGKKEGMVRIPGPNDIDFKPFAPPVSDVRVVLYPAATISGRVVDTQGQPVRDRDVTVRFHHPDDALITESSKTDASGHFSITGLMPGTHSIAVIPEEQIRAGFADATVELAPGESKTNFEIRYEGDSFVVAGRVVDERGQPIRRATVQLLGVRGSQPADGNTDGDGRFELLRIPEGTYMVMVFRDGFESIHASAKAGDRDLLFTLSSAAQVELRGRVVDARTGDPITKFDVQFVSGTTSEMEQHRFGLFFKFNDPNGEFTLDEVPRRNVTVIARSPGMEVKYEHIDLTSSLPGTVLIRLEPSEVARGHVTTEAGGPVANAYILLSTYPHTTMSQHPESMRKDWLERNAVARSDATGRFEVNSLHPDLHVMTAFHPDFGLGSIAITKEQVSEAEINIVVERGGTLKGRVTMGGAPQENATVRILTKGLFGETLGMARTDPNGNYTIEWTPAGTISATVRLVPAVRSAVPFAGREATADILIEEDADAILDFAFAGIAATIGGTVKTDGQPVTAGEAFLTLEVGGRVEWNSTMVNNDGTFFFSDVPEGRATLVVVSGTMEERTNATVDAFVVEPGTDYTFDLDVAPGQTLSGTIWGLRPEENHVNVFVYAGEFRPTNVSPSMERRDLRGSATVKADGSFTIRGLEPGVYAVVISAAQLGKRNELVGKARREELIVEIPTGQDVRIGDIRMPTN